MYLLLEVLRRAQLIITSFSFVDVLHCSLNNEKTETSIPPWEIFSEEKIVMCKGGLIEIRKKKDSLVA